MGWTLLSTGGTARSLTEAGCTVSAVGEHTGFPEILGGRVKTLHPRIFAGILAAPNDDHTAQLAEHDIPAIDLVVVNLYPFKETVARDGVALDEAVEQIDIGGPSLLRAAAKNHARVTVVVDPADYPIVLAELAAGGVSLETRRKLAVKTYRHTAAYDAAIAAHLPGLMGDHEPASTAAVAVAGELLDSGERALRYGENPHQWGLVARHGDGVGLAGASQHQGKALSYNNLGDATGAWRLVWDLPSAGVAVIKHANPCGVGLADDMAEAFRIARATDPLSAFGGVIAANRPVNAAFAEAVVEQFAEVVVAPGYDEAALKIFEKKKNLRVLEAAPAAKTGTAMELAWRVVKHVGSNAIVVGAADRILGIGAGQMSRVDAAKIAVAQAVEHGHDLEGSVAASDAFFPFPDGVQALHAAGVRAVIQPGGSIKDKDVVAACDELGVAMVMTGRRHFRH